MTTLDAYRIDGGGRTLVIGGPVGRVPAIAYFGPSLPAREDLVALVAAQALPKPHAGLDLPLWPSLFPEAGHGHMGTPALSAHSPGPAGAERWITRLAVTGITAAGARATVRAFDAVAALSLEISLSLETGTGVLRAVSEIANRGDRPLVVDFLAAPALPVPTGHGDLLHWTGRWCAEMTRQATPWPRGALVLESRLGRTSHETFPGLVSRAPGAGETAGEVLAVHLGWSGNWRMIAEDHAPGLRQILAGVLYLPGEAVLAPGARLSSPVLFAATGEGLGEASAAFHAEVRGHILDHPRPSAPRPVHFNSWEAVYFNLSVPALKDLADAAAAVGAERFVVDDGWFPARHRDNAGLGDWWLDTAKFPDGFAPLIEHVRGLGMGFGLWVEPEMVNEDSDLFRAHPDWVLAVPGHPHLVGRQQLVLDIARPEVAGYLFEKLDAVLSANAIDYLKWDMNRVLTAPGRNGHPVAAEQPPALYALLQRLRARHPGVEIESCSSGGGRMDFAILAHTQRVWLSDNNDAHDRWRMNREASVFFPPEIFGHHVGPSPCHTSGRRLSMAYRAFTAAVGGHMGLELDLRALTGDERAVLASAIAAHKRWRGLLHGGRVHRLETEAPVRGMMTVAEDGGRFLAAFVQGETLSRSSGPVVRLAGLDRAARYRLRLAEGAPFRSSGDRGYTSPLAGPDGWVASGLALERSGLRLATGWPDEVMIIEGVRVD